MTRRAEGRGQRQAGSSAAARGIACALALAATFTLGILLASAERAQATTLARLGFEELVTRSSVALTGKVTALTTREASWPGVGTVLFTDVTLSVGRVIRGGAWTAPQVVVRVPGGTIGERTQIWAGAPRFSRDEQVLVFLRRVGERLWTTGWEQGKYRLSSDGSTVLGSPRLPIGAPVALARLEQHIRLVSPSALTPVAPAPSTPDAPGIDASVPSSDAAAPPASAELRR